jgi:hypothetical protein
MSKVEFWNPTPLLQKAVALVDPKAELVHREKAPLVVLAGG